MKILIRPKGHQLEIIIQFSMSMPENLLAIIHSNSLSNTRVPFHFRTICHCHIHHHAKVIKNVMVNHLFRLGSPCWLSILVFCPWRSGYPFGIQPKWCLWQVGENQQACHSHTSLSTGETPLKGTKQALIGAQPISWNTQHVKRPRCQNQK